MANLTPTHLHDPNGVIVPHGSQEHTPGTGPENCGWCQNTLEKPTGLSPENGWENSWDKDLDVGTCWEEIRDRSINPCFQQTIFITKPAVQSIRKAAINLKAPAQALNLGNHWRKWLTWLPSQLLSASDKLILEGELALEARWRRSPAVGGAFLPAASMRSG